jgi:hypothetical protein
MYSELKSQNVEYVIEFVDYGSSIIGLEGFRKLKSFEDSILFEVE